MSPSIGFPPLRKDEDVWEHERHDERGKRAYLAMGAVDRIGLLADSPTRTRPHRRRPVPVATGAMK